MAATAETVVWHWTVCSQASTEALKTAALIHSTKKRRMATVAFGRWNEDLYTMISQQK
jgi:hypothetical protein